MCLSEFALSWNHILYLLKLVDLETDDLHDIQDEIFCACRFSQTNDKNLVLYTAVVTGGLLSNELVSSMLLFHEFNIMAFVW